MAYPKAPLDLFPVLLFVQGYVDWVKEEEFLYDLAFAESLRFPTAVSLHWPNDLLNVAHKDWISSKFSQIYATRVIIFCKHVHYFCIYALFSLFPLNGGRVMGMRGKECWCLSLVAGAGFEPAAFRLWAWRATGLLHPAIRPCDYFYTDC